MPCTWDPKITTPRGAGETALEREDSHLQVSGTRGRRRPRTYSQATLPPSVEQEAIPGPGEAQVLQAHTCLL